MAATGNELVILSQLKGLKDAQDGSIAGAVAAEASEREKQDGLLTNQIAAKLSTVAHDDTLTGNGTSGSPLAIADGNAFSKPIRTVLNLNDARMPGLYDLVAPSSNGPHGGNGNRGGVIVVRNAGSVTIGQIAVQNYKYSGGVAPGLYFRSSQDSGDNWSDWVEFAKTDDLSNYVSSSELASQLAGYVTDGELTQGLQAESSEREKQDGLLEDAISGKIAATDIKAGANVSVSTQGNAVTVAATVPDVSGFVTKTAADAAYAPKSHTHTAQQITGLTANRALVSDANGHPAVSAVTNTELGYLDGVTSNVQTQLDGKLSTSGTAAAASKLATSRTISLTGNVTGSASFDGTANASITATIANGAVTADRLADTSVSTAKLANNAVTPAKMASDPVYIVRSASDTTSISGKTVVKPCILVVTGGDVPQIVYAS